MILSVFLSSSVTSPHFPVDRFTRPIAPAAISARPRGIFVPVKNRMAPRARSAPLRIAVRRFNSRWYSSDFSPDRSRDTPPPAPPPLELLFPPSLLIWSKDASCVPASFAAAPTPEIAAAWLCSISADFALSPNVPTPKRSVRKLATTCVIDVRTRKRDTAHGRICE